MSDIYLFVAVPTSTRKKTEEKKNSLRKRAFGARALNTRYGLKPASLVNFISVLLFLFQVE